MTAILLKVSEVILSCSDESTRFQVGEPARNHLLWGSHSKLGRSWASEAAGRGSDSGARWRGRRGES